MNLEPFRHCFPIALHDTDAAGVLFFAHLFRHAHDAYEAWIATIGFPMDAMLRDGELALPLVHAEADYRRPLRHGDRVEVTLSVAEAGNRSFKIDYRFQTPDGDLVATARTVHACLHRGEGRPCPLPAALLSTLRQLLAQSDRDAERG